MQEFNIERQYVTDVYVGAYRLNSKSTVFSVRGHCLAIISLFCPKCQISTHNET